MTERDMPEAGPHGMLVEQMRAGGASREQVLELLRPELVRAGARFVELSDAEDVVQAALHTAWRKVDGFRGQTDGELRSWLRTIVRRECLMLHRRRSRLHEDLLAGEAPATGASTPSEAARRIEECDRLRDLLAELSDEQFEALTLRYLEGWKVADIAAQIGKSESAVGGLLSRGLRQLRGRTSPSEWSRLLG